MSSTACELPEDKKRKEPNSENNFPQKKSCYLAFLLPCRENRQDITTPLSHEI